MRKAVFAALIAALLTSATARAQNAPTVTGGQIVTTINAGDYMGLLQATGPQNQFATVTTLANAFRTTGTTIATVTLGGTGLATGTSGGFPAYTAAGTMASTAAMPAAHAIVGAGVGAVPVDSKWVLTAPTTLATLTAGGDSLTYTMPAVSDTIAGLAAVQTLSAKTLANTNIDQSFVVSTAQLDATTNTTLATPTGLSMTLVAGKSYVCEGHLVGTSTTNGGAKVAVVGTASLTATSSSFTAEDWNGTTQNSRTTSTTLGNSIVATTTVYTDIIVKGAIVVNAGGTINLQFAQNASHADTSSVYVNSYFWCKRVN